MPHERKPLPLPVLAPHAADQVVSAEPDKRVHRLTVDAALQRTLQDLARERAHVLGPKMSVAIMAVDNETGEVRARVGSGDYFDERRAGQVDSPALRSPGSTLKPFIYGLAFGRSAASGDSDRRQADAVRRLRAEEFRSRLPGHRHERARCRCRSTCPRWRA